MHPPHILALPNIIVTKPLVALGQAQDAATLQLVHKPSLIVPDLRFNIAAPDNKQCLASTFAAGSTCSCDGILFFHLEEHLLI